MRGLTRFILVPVAAGILVTGCSAAGGAAPSAAPAATPAPTTTVVVASYSPPPQTDGEGDEVVTGVVIDIVQTVIETYTTVGSHEEVRGGVVVANHVANDVRASGAIKTAFSIDWYTKAGPFWATQTITNDGGTWTGPCTGVTTARGSFGPFSCWLSGTGAYEGWTYYVLSTPGGGVPATSNGIIFEGAPPEP